MMRTTRSGLILLLLLFAASLSLPARGAADGRVRVAVASNFSPTLDAMLPAFEASGKYTVVASSGSSGKLFAQIRNGAPFDVFLSADAERPRLLEQTGMTVTGSRFTYAEGRLVLWSRDPKLAPDGCLPALRRHSELRIAIANPQTAPYGEAARQALVGLGLWEQVRPRLVFGENIAQTLQFAANGGAQLGFVAAAQLGVAALPAAACLWEVPAGAHEPIRQQAVLLKSAADNEAAKAFLSYLRSDAGRALILRHGYRLDESDGP